MTTKTITHPGTVSAAQYNYAGSGATLINAGTVGQLTVPGKYGVKITGLNDTLINSGSVLTGGSTGGYSAAVFITGATGDAVINQATGIIKGGGMESGGVVLPGGATGIITNAGLISGSSQSGHISSTGDGIALNSGGIVNNYGTVTGGLFVEYGNGAITNSGTILGNGASAGIDMETSYTNGDTITNLAGGTIAADGAVYGGIRLVLEGGTITNAGTISGGVALAPSYTNRVVLDATGVFVGTVDGGTAADSTLELGSGTASLSTLTGFGSQFINFGTLTFDPTSDWFVPVAASSITSTTINGFNSGDTIDVTGFTATNTGTLAGGPTVTLTNSGGTREVLNFGAPVSNFVVTTGAGISGTVLTTVCFCAGTMIATPAGEAAVENLESGDQVLTVHNGPREIRWIGRGKVLSTGGRPSAATPVIVCKGAVADNVPNRDLHVTKAHSLYLDDVLIPVEFLVNHRTILWDDRGQEVEIYHIELDSHDVILANGTPAESYRDDGNRWLFQNANSGWGLLPQESCARVLTGGPVVDTVWRRLLDRAGPREVPMTDDPDLHLIVDGIRVAQWYRHDNVCGFRLPPRPNSVIIASRTGVPAALGIARDPRSLGVAMRQVTIRLGAKFMLFDADDERLTAGFHEYEPADRLRWTDGYGQLPTEDFARFDLSGAELVLHLGGTTQYPDQEAHMGQQAG